MYSRIVFPVVLLCFGGGVATRVLAQNQDVSPLEATDAKRQQSEFYDPQMVQTIHLTMLESDRQRMLAALPKCIYVPATFTWNGKTIKQVGVRFKGNSSANPQQKHKRSYLIKFSKYEKSQRFLGMERI